MFTGVDSSAAAISLAKGNASFPPYDTTVKFECQEVERFMNLAAKAKQTWDIVVLGSLTLCRS